MVAPEMALAVRPGMDVQVGSSYVELLAAAHTLGRRDELMEQRRADRSEHHYKQIWSKDPHGGAYRKAGGATGGYDALLQLADGETRAREAGYERPQTGPTTNFVGNHMTQGAIDMMQMDQQRLDPAAAHRQLKQYRQYYHPPRRIAAELDTNGSSAEPTAMQCQSYSWEDRGPALVIRVPLPGAVPPATATQHVRCEFGPNSLQLRIQESLNGSCRPLVLRIHSLFSAILPTECGWQLNNGSRFPRNSGGCAAAGALVVAGSKPWVVCITLHKADPSLPWAHLSSHSPLQSKDLAPNGAPAVSLATLRSALRRQRAAKQPGDGLLFALPASEGSEILALDSSVVDPAVDPQVTLLAAANAAVLGNHAEAVRQLTSAIAAAGNPLESLTETTDRAADCLVLRAKAYCELGNLKAAVADCTRALELIKYLAADPANGGYRRIEAVAALTVRGQALEQLERYTESAGDYEAVAQLSPGARDPVGVSAAASLARVRGVAKTAAALITSSGPRPESWTSVPRPGLRHFEHRGKAGAAF